MTDTVKVTTNNVPRDVIDAWQLTESERVKFDYLDWAAIDEGSDSVSFFRYKGELYDLSEFEAAPVDAGSDDEDPMGWLRGWHGYQSDSFFSGMVIRWADDRFETVVVGTYYVA